MRKITVVNNDTHEILKFDSKAAAKRWAKKHGYELGKSPMSDNSFYTKDPAPVPDLHKK